MSVFAEDIFGPTMSLPGFRFDQEAKNDNDGEWTDRTTLDDAAQYQRRWSAITVSQSVAERYPGTVGATRIQTREEDAAKAYLSSLNDGCEIRSVKNPDGTYTHSYYFVRQQSAAARR